MEWVEVFLCTEERTILGWVEAVRDGTEVICHLKHGERGANGCQERDDRDRSEATYHVDHQVHSSTMECFGEITQILVGAKVTVVFHTGVSKVVYGVLLTSSTHL